jgi:hypothetical protein
LLDTFLTSPNTTSAIAASAGTTLGHFLKDLHAAFDDAPVSITEELRSTFANTEGEALLCEIIGNTVAFMRDAGVEDYVTLGRRALDNWMGRERTAFGQGDIWFGTLLVGVKNGEVEVGICDWEFAGFNHPAGDIGQLGECVHLQRISQLLTICQLERPILLSRLVPTSIFFVASDYSGFPNDFTVLLICILFLVHPSTTTINPRAGRISTQPCDISRLGDD